MKLHTLFPPILELKSSSPIAGHEVSALHSGNIGDVVYSLPTAYALGVNHYILNAYVEGSFGTRVMTREAAGKLAPLLLDQGTIRRVSVIHSNLGWEFAPVEATGLNFILDSFRNNSTEPLLHLVHRHALAFGQQVRGDRRWILSETCQADDLPLGIERPYLVVGLTNRYRRWGDDYYVTLLRDIPPERIIFVGVEHDLPHKRHVAGAYLKATDFKQLARIISEAALFIGNASFPYALAEALKVPRLIELADGVNVAPLDPSGLALHLHTQESLRFRILGRLGLPYLDSTRLTDQLRMHQAQIKSYQTHISQLEEEKRKLETSVAALETSLAVLETSLAVMNESIGGMRAAIERPAFLAKCLLKRAMLSNRWSRSVHFTLSRIEPLRRRWREFGKI